MHQQKNNKVLIYFFLLLIFSSINNIGLNKSQILNLNKIIVSGLDEKDSMEIVKKIQMMDSKDQIVKFSIPIHIKIKS